MKRVLLYCVIGLLCISAVPYTALGDEIIPGNLSVSGNVGIGTPEVNDPLGIQGGNGVELSGTVSVVNGNVFVQGTGTQFLTELISGDTIVIAGRTYTVESVTTNTMLSLFSPSYQGVTASGLTAYHVARLLTVTSAGTVGIGMADPTFDLRVGSKLSIVTPAGGTGLAIGTSATQPSFAINPNSNGSWSMFDHVGSWTAGISQSGGNVGIGVQNPNAKLQIKGSVSLGSGTASANKALCWTSTGAIGYCSSAINASGACTCNKIN